MRSPAEAAAPSGRAEPPTSPGGLRPGVPGGQGQPQRRDAQRNRETFLAAARTAFAEHGADASLEQVARDAGLAIGTLYRHFPHRLDLLLAVYEPRASELLTEAEAALQMDDPWEGFRRCLEALVSMQAGDRGFTDLMCTRFPGDARTETLHNRLCDLMKKVIQRGQESGDVRPDITDADIVTLMLATGRIIEATGHVAPNAWRRHLYLMMDAFQAASRHELPEPPLTDRQLYQAMAERGAC